MLAVFSVVVACLTVILVEGSLVFYRHPVAPQWLKANTSLQVTISCMLSMGAIGSVFMIGQYLVGSGNALPTPAEAGAIVVALVVTVFLYRWIRSVGRTLTGAGPARVTDSTPAPTRPSAAPGHAARGRRKAA